MKHLIENKTNDKKTIKSIIQNNTYILNKTKKSLNKLLYTDLLGLIS